MNKTIKVSIAVAMAIAASTLVLALPYQSTNAGAATNAVNGSKQANSASGVQPASI